MYDYQRPDPGWCGDRKRGASMGRPSDLPFDTTATLHVRRVPLNEGGYDPGGAYWGSPNDLWCVWSVDDDDELTRYLRAPNLEAVRAQFPRATWAPETGPSDEDIADMLDAYITCALWSSTGDDEEPLEKNYGPDDIAPETRKAMRRDVESFARANAETIAKCIGHKRCSWEQAGHDFWLTRCGHGAGFWDGDWPTAEGEALTKASEAFGGVDLYIGDDGKVYG